MSILKPVMTVLVERGTENDLVARGIVEDETKFEGAHFRSSEELIRYLQLSPLATQYRFVVNFSKSH